IAGPKPGIFLGNSWEQLFLSRHEVEIRRVKKYGKLFGVFEGKRAILHVADPVLIKHILVKDFHAFTDRPLATNAFTKSDVNQNLGAARGEQWRRMRTALTPMFTSGRLRRTYPLIGHCLRQLMAAMVESADDGRPLDVYKAYECYAIDTIAAAAWGVETDAGHRPNDPLVSNARQIGQLQGARRVLLWFIPRPVLKVMGVNTYRNARVADTLRDLIRQLLDHRRGQQNGHDFISQMVRARAGRVAVATTSTVPTGGDGIDATSSFEGHHINEGDEHKEAVKRVLTISDNNNMNALNETEIINNSYIFFIAGYHQLVITLSYCTLELALNPRQQELLYAEVRAVAPEPDSEIPYDTLATLPYLDAVLSESMRIHASPYRLQRYATADYRLPGTDLTIRAGQEVHIPIYAIHHLDEHYPEPQRFDPERFMGERGRKLTPYTYLPFGAGPRSCVGMRFALLEVKYALAHIVRRYRFVRCPETNSRPPLANHFFLIVPKEVYVKIEPREH
ncbi:unnamed protein product, partial [Medioppia subpectinata]